mgnify:FL=1|jgi:hypothetical protein
MAYYKVSVAEILKDKPVNTKLYSPLFGDVYFSHVEDSIINVEHHAGISKFFNSGRYFNFDESEPLLFPSMEMRDWNKFAWKKGDVLVNSRGLKILFDRWANDNYTSFYAKTINLVEDGFLDTNLHTLASEKEAKSFIKCIEEKLGGKLNRETLEVEKAQPEFKDGDIVYMGNAWNEYIGIIKNRTSGNQIETYAHCHKDSKEEAVLGLWLNKNDSDELRLATNSEKQQLFDALAKEGKAWDAETKTLEDLPKKCEFKPFDKVLVRNTDTEEWFPGFFEKFDSTWNYPYHIMNRRCMTDFAFKQCIPYEGNEHLLGTTKDVEG